MGEDDRPARATTGDPRYSLFLKHVGVWRGSHRIFSPAGELLDEYSAEVSCRCAGDRWHQTTRRSWPDGREETTEFHGTFREGRLEYEHPRVQGAGVAANEKVIVSCWRDPAQADVEWCAIITLLDAGHRVRTVQHMASGALTRLIHIDERRVS